MIYIIGILSLIIVVLIYLYTRKKYIDKSELINYQKDLDLIRKTYNALDDGCREREQYIQEAEEKYRKIIEEYKNATAQNQEDLDKFFAQQRAFRQSELDTEFEQKARKNEENLQLNYSIKKQEFDDLIAMAQEQSQKNIEAAHRNEAAIIADVQLQQQRYEGLLAPLRQYEKDKQEKLFYTIQVPDEYKQDIDFLLNTVSQSVQHPDIINKLVWAEYIKPYIDETFKRVGIEDKPGIYKLTNIDTGKAYIGKSTNIKKRIADHFKSAIGIATIADQAVHHAILTTGFWNWSIEYIIYCDKDQLNNMEKYYIDFFKTQDYGYNKNAGGGG